MLDFIPLPELADSNMAVFATAITIGLSLVSVLHTVMTNWFYRRRQKVARAVELYEELYSIENYTLVVAPVFEIMLQWNGLPEPHKTHYRKAVLDGWIGFYNEADNSWRDRICQPTDRTELKNEADLVERHYANRRSTSTSEHDSLTCFLYYWSKVDQLAAAGIADLKVLRELFAPSYTYYRDFLFDLKNEISNHVDKKDVQPRWFGAIERLDRALLCCR